VISATTDGVVGWLVWTWLVSMWVQRGHRMAAAEENKALVLRCTEGTARRWYIAELLRLLW
jgi:hypothetical protein